MVTSKNSLLHVRRNLVAASVSAILAGTFFTATPVVAADGADDEVTELVITGSRITRRDYEANSPSSASTRPRSSSAAA